MGHATDIEELMPKALLDVKWERRRKIIWAAVTSLGTIIGATWTTSWKVNDYLHESREKNRELREAILVMDKKLEGLEEIQKEAREAKVTADKALLYAQLVGRRGEK